MRVVSRIALVVAIVIGFWMILIGTVVIEMGYDARDRIRNALAKELIITSQDASIPGVPVEDVETARAQHDVIEDHAYGRFGPYTGMDRNDPNRETYLNGLILRNTLNLAILGFGVADMAIGLGAVTIVLGVIMILMTIPAHLLFTRAWR